MGYFPRKGSSPFVLCEISWLRVIGGDFGGSGCRFH